MGASLRSSTLHLSLRSSLPHMCGNWYRGSSTSDPRRGISKDRSRGFLSCIGGMTAHSVPHRSVSQLNSYFGCGLRYAFERRYRLPQSPAAWSIQGVAVHKAIEHWELSHRTAPLGLLIDIFT